MRRLGSSLHRPQYSPARRIAGNARVSVPLLVAAGVLLWAAIPAMAATPRVGKWEGTASVPAFGLTVPVPVTFSTVRTSDGGRHVKGFVLSRVKLECTGGGNNRSFGSHGFILTANPKVRDGKFRITESKPLGSWTQTLKGGGRFTRKAKARGTLNLTLSKPGITCTTGESNWKATLE